MSKQSLSLHLINKQLKVWYREQSELKGDKMWNELVKAKIRKLERRRDTALNGVKLKPIGKVSVAYTNYEQTNYSIQNEINKWLERNEVIETM
jgi:hypothetical protein